MNLLKKITYNLNRKLIKKIENNLENGLGLKKIIVTGTVGKSSSVLLINRLFSLNGYNVISGTTLNKNINSFEGLCMTLIRSIFQSNTGKSFKEVEKSIHLEIESKSGLIKLIFKIRFIIIAIYFAYFSPIKTMQEKTILVYEVGFDYQGESDLYDDLFDKIDLSIITNLTYEHSSNFNNESIDGKITSLVPLLNEKFIDQLNSPSITNVLKNISLEQFSFVNNSENIIYPTVIGSINNEFYVNNESEQTIAIPQREKDFSLSEKTLDLKFSNKYILPDTFAKNASILSKISTIFNLDYKTVSESLASDNLLPHSRFSKLNGINNSTIIDSSYNSDPESLSSFIKTVQEVIAFHTVNGSDMAPRHIVILGEMRELGDTSVISHSIILEKLEDLYQTNKNFIGDIILLGKEWLKCDSSDIAMSDESITYIKFKYRHFKVFQNVSDISNYLLEGSILPENWFWIKGSQNTIFLEILVEKLLLDKTDIKYLCRNTDDWKKIKKSYS